MAKALLTKSKLAIPVTGIERASSLIQQKSAKSFTIMSVHSTYYLHPDLQNLKIYVDNLLGLVMIMGLEM